MIQLSLAARESIKTGLAMSLACGCAMALGWSNPYWACIAVAVVSLPTVGESLQKCVQRLWGTIAAGLVALGCLALFPQERWPFIACIAGYVGLCAYRITTSRAVYFWFLSGYVSLLIAAAIIGTSAQQAFSTAVLRLQETGLGILAYALVSVFLWPQRSATDLDSTVKSLLGMQAKIAHLSFARLRDHAGDDTADKLLGLGDQFLVLLRRRLDAAGMEQFAVRGRRVWWLQVIGALEAMQSSLRMWQESFPELEHLDMDAVLPDLAPRQEAMRARFGEMEALLDGATPDREPARPWPPDGQRLGSLSHLQRAAVLTLLAALERVDATSRTLADSLLALRGGRMGSVQPPTAVGTGRCRKADADSYAVLGRGMAAVWIASLLWIVIDPPGHLAFVVFVGLFTLMGVMAPQMDWLKFLFVNLVGVVLAAILYVFVMPGLSRPWEFLALLSGLTAGISYISWHPRLAGLKLAGVVPFIMMTNIQNRQSYDFALFVNNAAAMVSGILVTAALARIPLPSRPEQMFERVLRRFFRQAESFLSACDAAPRRAREKLRLGDCLASLQGSAGKLGGWANTVDEKILGAGAKARAAALVASLNTIVHSFQLLADVRANVPDETEAANEAFKTWHEVLRQAVRHWGQGPRTASSESATLARLRNAYGEAAHGVENTFETFTADLPPEEYACTYLLLGGYRGAHRALHGHAALSADLDWAHWQENRL